MPPRIVCTQPRRDAAISPAPRAAAETEAGVPLGNLVGYTLRFDNGLSRLTHLKSATDSALPCSPRCSMTAWFESGNHILLQHDVIENSDQRCVNLGCIHAKSLTALE